MHIEQEFCHCCVTEKEWEAGIRKEELQILPEKGFLTHCDFVACKICDGDLWELANRNK